MYTKSLLLALLTLTISSTFAAPLQANTDLESRMVCTGQVDAVEGATLTRRMVCTSNKNNKAEGEAELDRRMVCTGINSNDKMEKRMICTGVAEGESIERRMICTGKADAGIEARMVCTGIHQEAD